MTFLDQGQSLQCVNDVLDQGYSVPHMNDTFGHPAEGRPGPSQTNKEVERMFG